jgi:hypothetical protein
MAEPKDAELRVNVTRRMLELVDACAHSEGKGRTEFITELLQPEIERRLHAATLLCRMAGINPTAPDRNAE